MKAAIILLITVLTVSVWALGHAGNGGHMAYGDHMMSYGGGLFMWLLFLIVVGVVVYVVVQITRSKGDDRAIHETPMDILKKRYAKGEITREEFEDKRKQIES